MAVINDETINLANATSATLTAVLQQHQNNINDNHKEIAALKSAKPWIPDLPNRVFLLTNAGTWTANADGFVQIIAVVNKPSTAYGKFTMTVNGMTAVCNEYSGMLSTGDYDYASIPFPVQTGDVVTTAVTGNGITMTLYFIPSVL